jgi:hypothetical protein
VDIKSEYKMLTPAAPDDIYTSDVLQKKVEAASKDLVELNALDMIDAETLEKQQNQEIDARAEYDSFGNARKSLGFVYGTGGARVDDASKMPMDWGVIRPYPDDPVWSGFNELNRVSPYCNVAPETRSQTYRCSSYHLSHSKRAPTPWKPFESSSPRVERTTCGQSLGRL